MYEDIDTRRHPDECLARPSIAGDDYASGRSVDAVSVRRQPPVIHRKRGNTHATTIVSNSRMDLVRAQAIPSGHTVVEFALLDIHGERFVEVLEHCIDTGRSEYGEWLVTTRIP